MTPKLSEEYLNHSVQALKVNTNYGTLRQLPPMGTTTGICGSTT